MLTKERLIAEYKDTGLYDQVVYLVGTAQESRTSRTQKLAWVLSPGLLRGWLQFGAMDILNMMGLQPDLVVGSSIGAYIGIVPATNTPITRVEEAHKEYDTKTIFEKSYLSRGIFSSNHSIVLLRKNFSQYQRLEDLPTPMHVVATDCENGEYVVFSSGPLFKIIQASIAHPIFPPVEVSGRWYRDGGLSNPAPVDVAFKKGADFVVFLDSQTEKIKGPYTVPEELPLLTRVFLESIPNNESKYLGKAYAILKAFLVGKLALHEGMNLFAGVQNQLIKRTLELHPPHLYINFSEALNGDNAIPLRTESFRNGDALIEKGRQAVLKHYILELIELRKKLDSTASVPCQT